MTVADDILKQAAEQAREVLPEPIGQLVRRRLISLMIAGGETGRLADEREKLARAVLALPVPARTTLAETRIGFDWCPHCKTEAGTDRFTYTGVERCAVCSKALVPVPTPAVDREAVARLIHVEVAKVEHEIDQAHYECGNNAHPARMETWEDMDSGENQTYLNAADALISAGLVRGTVPVEQDGGEHRA